MYKWFPILKRKDRLLKCTRPPVLLVDHCENFELLFSQNSCNFFLGMRIKFNIKIQKNA